jgi:hypothetical protein
LETCGRERLLVTPRSLKKQTYARAGGALYLVIFALGWTLFAFPHISPAGGAASIHAITVAEPRLRLVSAAELLMYLCDVPLAVILYVLLRPVDRGIALIAAFFRLGNAVVGAIAVVARLAVLTICGDAGYQSAFTPGQLQGIVSMLLSVHGDGVDIGIIFFAFHLILLGYLIFRSGYLPKVLGVLLPIAGVCYIVASFADIVSPAFAAQVPAAILLPGFAAELLLCLWLLVKGVNVPKWRDRAHAPQ